MAPEEPKEFLGMKIFVSETLPKNAIEFHHADGRIDRFVIGGK